MHPSYTILVDTVSTFKWALLFSLHLPYAVSLGLSSSLHVMTKQEAHFTTTISDPSVHSYPQCGHISGQWKDEFCWDILPITLVPTLAASVACNNVTYITSLPYPTGLGSPTTVFEYESLSTPLGEGEYGDLYYQWHLNVLPRLEGLDALGECGREANWGENNTYQCEIYAEDIHLFYSPPDSPLSRDMCAITPLLTVTDFGNAKHVPQTVLKGMTLYKDRVYVSVDKIHAWSTLWSQTEVSLNETKWDCRKVPLGTTVYNTIIELQSHEVSTLRAPYIDRVFPFNYADLVEPAPGSAWLGRSFQARTSPYYFPPGMSETYPPGASVTLEAYQPWLAMPTMVTRIDSAWASCVGYALGWRDPPIAMNSAASVAPPKITAILSAGKGQTVVSGVSNMIAMPGSMPSRTAKATVPGMFPVEATASASDRLGNSGSQNGRPMPKEPNGQTYQENGPRVDPKTFREYSPNDRSPPLIQLSAPRAQEAIQYGSFRFQPGQSPFTLKNGQTVTANIDGLVVDTRSRGIVTVPYSALATKTTKSGSTMPPQLDQLYSDIRDALETLQSDPSAGSNTLKPTSSMTYGKAQETRRKGGGSVSAGGSRVAYIGALGLWLLIQF